MIVVIVVMVMITSIDQELDHVISLQIPQL